MSYYRITEDRPATEEEIAIYQQVAIILYGVAPSPYLLPAANMRYWEAVYNIASQSGYDIEDEKTATGIRDLLQAHDIPMDWLILWYDIDEVLGD